MAQNRVPTTSSGVDRMASSKAIADQFKDIQEALNDEVEYNAYHSKREAEQKAQFGLINSKPILPYRTPWIMTTVEWLEAPNSESKALVWACNPSDVSWSMPLRMTESKNKSGTILHVWRDPYRQTFYDEPILGLNLQSGNIMPISETQMAPGLNNFYAFMELVDAPKLTKTGKPNYVVIQYTSRLFPQITLIGMFSPDGIRFTDTSSDPNRVTSWSATFTVYDSVPRLSISQLAGSVDSGEPTASNAFMMNEIGFKVLQGKPMKSTNMSTDGLM